VSCENQRHADEERNGETWRISRIDTRHCDLSIVNNWLISSSD
jgi:hypothetical protein